MSLDSTGMQHRQYRKRPVVIEAVQWDGTLASTQFLFEWAGAIFEDGALLILTNEGVMRCEIGDWVIKEPFPTSDRRFYPCKPEIFEATYEKA